jgi:hypothetical protein
VKNYLLAIKSIYLRIKEGSIFIIDDGSLTGNDLALLREHFSDVTFIRAKDVDTGQCPTGGTWERLNVIATLAKDFYVVQVDSDLLAIKPLPEIIDAFNRNIAFTQSGEPSSKFIDFEEASTNAYAQAGDHIQVLAERALAAVKLPHGRRYVRGCSGFAGFPRGMDLQPVVQAFSVQMANLIGQDTWSKWGSEQVTSNYVIANCQGAMLLDPWLYLVHWAGRDSSSARLIHFVGTFRHRFGTYVREAKRVVAELEAPSAGLH